MVQKRPTGQLAVRAVEREPTAAELFDPAALERRLVEARARRAEALALRAQTAEAPPAAAPSQPVPAPAPAPDPTAVLPAADLPEAEPRGLARRPYSMAAIFLAGLGLGAAAVLAPVVLRERTPAPAVPAASTPQPNAPAQRLAETVPATFAVPEAASRAPAALPPPAAEATPPGSEAAAPPSADVSPAPVSPAGPPPRTPDPTGATAVAALAPSPAAPGTDALPPPPDLPGAAAEEISMEIPKAEPEAEAEATPPTTLPAATRVFVHHPPGKRAAAQAAAAALTDAGVADVTIVAAPVSIARTNVRFFHAADADAAREIAGLLPPTGGAPETRDFTDFTPPPRTGMVEVWLAGEAPDAPAPARTTAVRAPAPPVLVLPSPAEDVAEEVARILVQRALDSLSEGRP